MNLQQIYHDFKDDLQCIEKELIVALQTEQKILERASLHPLEAGGKRLRPLFVLLAGQFGNHDHRDHEKLKTLSVSMELIHMATLVHDDVIDHSFMRRGRKTVRAVWDDQIAMIAGDFIFSRALENVAELENPDIHSIFSDMLLQMCHGEIAQYGDLFNKDVSFRNYLHRIKKKTALLFAVSCELGALISSANEKMIRAMYRYGYFIGMAFQLIDDVLDFVGDEDTLGKPVGSDLCQGNVTLPVLYALQHAPETEKIRIQVYMDMRGKSDLLEEIVAIVQKTGGIDFTMDLAKRYIHKAIRITHDLPECMAKKSLQSIACFLGNRSY